ncbi:hypothetical protein Fmac_000473 [Flemingia macrophylla]|uniref:U-box domain-containing protein n=1 Tax=Flemingia macrophylla TaxID=520843 RepID=A0ABD1NFX9_9FABA
MLSTVNDDSSSSAFSDCNSDRSGEFPTASWESRRRLLVACTDDCIRQMVLNLESSSIEDRKQATMEIRLLAKNKQENRLKIARAGAIKPLISLISSADLELQEYAVTAVLNLSLCDENKEVMASSGAVRPLVGALERGTPTAKENAACALVRLSQREEQKVAIGRAGAIPALVRLLEGGGVRGKKDAATALYSLCLAGENRARAVRAGAVRALVELMAELRLGVAEKAAYVASVVVMSAEGREAVVEEGGIPVLVEMVEVGTQRQKEIAVGVLLQICQESVVYRLMVSREGAIPPLVSFSHSHANKKAEKLIELLRQPRSANVTCRTSQISA